MTRTEQYVIPPVHFVQITATTPSGTTVLPRGTRGLLVGTAGTLNVRTLAGTLSLLPFIEGVTPGLFTHVDAGGTAINIWAVL